MSDDSQAVKWDIIPREPGCLIQKECGRVYRQVQTFTPDGCDQSGLLSNRLYSPTATEEWPWARSLGIGAAINGIEAICFAPVVSITSLEDIIVLEPKVDDLTHSFDMINPHEVEGFIAAHPQLLSVLREAPSAITSYFPSAAIRLQILTDPEIPGRKDMFLGILTSLGAEEACERLDRLDKEWSLNAMEKADGLLCIDVEFA